MYFCGPLHMDVQRQDEPTYNSSVPIRDVALRTCQKQWTIGRGGERGSGISMLIVRHDDDDNDLLSWILFDLLIEPYSGATTPDQCGLGSDGNEGILRVPQSFKITGTSLLHCLILYQDTRWGGLTPVEMQSMYLVTLAD